MAPSVAHPSPRQPTSAPRRFDTLPVSYLSTTQRERYGRYPDTLSPDELAPYLRLDDNDREWIATGSCSGYV